MKPILLNLAFLLTARSVGVAEHARPASTVTHSELNLRADPGSNYSAVAAVRAGGDTVTYRYTAELEWRDVSWVGYADWITPPRVHLTYHGQALMGSAPAAPMPPVLTGIVSRAVVYEG